MIITIGGDLSVMYSTGSCHRDTRWAYVRSRVDLGLLRDMVNACFGLLEKPYFEIGYDLMAFTRASNTVGAYRKLAIGALLMAQY